MEPQRLEALLRADAVDVVDVRSGAEWAEGHIPGSHNVPLGRLVEQLDRLPRERPLVVHCQAGSREFVHSSQVVTRG